MTKVTTQVFKTGRKTHITATYGDSSVTVTREKGCPLFDAQERAARKILIMHGVDFRDVEPVEGDQVLPLPSARETRMTYTWSPWGTWKDYKPGGGYREAWTSQGVFHG